MRTSLRLMKWALGLAAGAAMAGSVLSVSTAKAQTFETQKALNGSLYGVVAPTFDGSNNSQLSFIRLWNGIAASQTFSVTVVGVPSGRTYGTANINVPAKASPQYPLTGSNSIVSLAGAAALNGGDTSYALYIQSPDTTGASGYQHVTFNPTTTLFGDASSCVDSINESSYAASNSLVLTNVHTTTLASYPSQVYIHNYSTAAATYKITVTEGATGAAKGSTQQTIAANSTYSATMAQLQSAVGWSPTSSELHANLVITDSLNRPPFATVSQKIVNNTLGGSIDMSSACALNAVAGASANTIGGMLAPMFDGAGNTQLSFLRLWNGAATSTQFSVAVIGIPSGRTYGTANITVATGASPQYPLTGSNSVVSLAGAAALNGGDTSYAVHITNSDPTAGYQHVTFNPATTLFGNASTCINSLNDADVAAANELVLTNVHTTTLASYPSQVYIHNYWNSATAYKIYVHEAATGALKGQIQQTIAANSTYSVSMAALQSAVGWTPTSSEFHANIVVADALGGVPYATVSQQIVNNTLGGSIDMSMACAVNPPQDNSGNPGGGLNGY